MNQWIICRTAKEYGRTQRKLMKAYIRNAEGVTLVLIQEPSTDFIIPKFYSEHEPLRSHGVE
jgi:hypothetical protein